MEPLVGRGPTGGPYPKGLLTGIEGLGFNGIEVYVQLPRRPKSHLGLQ